jgi:hypothetical protein
MKPLTGLLKTGRPGVYIEESEDGGYAVLVNRVVSRRAGGAVYAFAELAQTDTEEEARAWGEDKRWIFGSS